jgi:carbon storage regulator
MLVVARRLGERVRIGSDVRITVVAVSGSQVRLAIEAPDHVAIHREEVFARIEEANREAARAAAATPLEVALEPGGRE